MIVLSAHSTTARFLSLCALAVGFFCASFAWTFAAEVAVSPSTGTYTVGQSFTATLQVNPQGQSVNAVEAKLSFDNTKLSVVSVSKTGSVFSLWTTEPVFSNSAGTIDFGGGSPTPFSTRSNLLTVTFKVLAEGSGNVRVASASVLAADGQGTDVYTGAGNATYTFGPGTPTPTPTPTPTAEPEEEDDDSNAAITFGDPPRAPEAGSTVFLDPDVWYATKVGVFTWEVPFDVDVLALDISTSSEYEPKTIYDPPVEQLSIAEDMLEDGIQYLTMQYKNQVGWGAILHRKLMIDTVAPEAFKVNVRAGNSPTAFPILTFEAKDTISGIQKYEMSIASGEPFEVTPDEARLGYLLKDLEDGTYTVKVVAYDQAGNKTESSSAILITAGWHPPQEVVITSTIWDIFKGKNLAIMLLLLSIIGQFAYMTYARKQHEQKEQKLRKETKEIQDQMEKIFSALRDEIYDQINMITKHERLSKKEREAVEGLNQALEVSETLIEKEITDVSKILK
jgi:hypothetical protein